MCSWYWYFIITLVIFFFQFDLNLINSNLIFQEDDMDETPCGGEWDLHQEPPPYQPFVRVHSSLPQEFLRHRLAVQWRPDVRQRDQLGTGVHGLPPLSRGVSGLLDEQIRFLLVLNPMSHRLSRLRKNKIPIVVLSGVSHGYATPQQPSAYFNFNPAYTCFTN